jgi:hypothetical protein
MEYIFQELGALEPTEIEGRPELAGKKLKHMELRELVQRIMTVREEKKTPEGLTEFEALVAVGRYMHQKRIRVFGVNPTIARLVGPEDAVLSQLETPDDLVHILRHNADRIMTTLEDHPFSVSIDAILRTCFPHKAESSPFKPLKDEIEAKMPEEEKKANFYRDLAYIALGYALEENRVAVRPQIVTTDPYVETIMVGKAGTIP